MVLLRHKIFECNQILKTSVCFAFLHLIGCGNLSFAVQTCGEFEQTNHFMSLLL